MPNIMAKCKIVASLSLFQLHLCNWMAVVLLGWHAGDAIGSQSVDFAKDNSSALHIAAPIKPAAGVPPQSPKNISVSMLDDLNSAEADIIMKSAEIFNRSQHAYRVELTPFVRRDYESWIHAEAVAGTLACLLQFDGSILAALAWPEYLQPIDQFVPPALLSDLLPSIVAQGTYQGRLYSLGQFDSGMGLWGNRRHLRAAGLRIPTLNAPWNLAEFEQALAKLTALEDVDYAINFAFYYVTSGFYAYAYSPILQSFGGDLIDRRNYRTTKGVLDGPQSVAAMKHFQSWIEKGWTQVVFDRQDDFERGKTALSWNGHWVYRRYEKALGKNLVLLPLADFGHGIKTGMGSLSWGISSTCHEPAGAWAFLAHLMSIKEILRITNVNGAPPARWSSLAQSPLYGTQGPLRLFVKQLEAGGVPRPATPAYSSVGDAFTKAVRNIIDGGDVQFELSTAADIIDRTIAAHHGYPYP
jgi:multiple sugar transport system substrate-binding protein